jgi:hypothetical protein
MSELAQARVAASANPDAVHLVKADRDRRDRSPGRRFLAIKFRKSFMLSRTLTDSARRFSPNEKFSRSVRTQLRASRNKDPINISNVSVIPSGFCRLLRSTR